jgi:hypothetical protein
VDSYSRHNYTFVLTPACLESLRAARVELGIDVYPYPQRNLVR